MSTFLTSANALQIISRKIEEHQLPHHQDVTVRVRQLPIGVLNRLAKSSSGAGVEGDNARCELVRMSIVNEDGSEVFTSEQSQALKEASAPIFTDLLLVIGKANNKSKQQTDQDVDDLEKN